MRLTIRDARVVVDAAMKEAQRRNVPSAVAVVDAGGNLMAFITHEDAILAGRDLAISKAYTALALKMSSGDLGESVLPGGPFYGLNVAFPQRPLVTFAGGIPLRSKDAAVLGGVGVSGGTLEDDDAISTAAVVAFTRHLGDES